MYKLSVVIPTYNRQWQLQICLESLASSDFLKEDFEVVVVNDGGEIADEPLLLVFHQRLNISLIHQKNGGPSIARNTGARAAQGEFVVFTDDDCWVDAAWLKELAVCCHQYPDRAVAGKTINALPNNLYAATSQLILEYAYAYYNTNAQAACFFGAANVAFPRQQFLALGGFDPWLKTSEDRDLADRWISQGYQITYTPNALIYHANNLTFRSFCRQHFEYGRGAFKFHTLREKRGHPPFQPDYQFHWRIFKQALISSSFIQKMGMIFLIGIFEVANLIGFMHERRSYSERKAYIPD